MRRTIDEIMAFCASKAEEFRANPTEAEITLWSRLYPLGFDRQVPILGETKNGGGWYYILDFYHSETKLCVEVDGAQHKFTKGADRRRDTRLKTLGIRTMRFENKRVLKNLDEVEAAIKGEI